MKGAAPLLAAVGAFLLAGIASTQQIEPSAAERAAISAKLVNVESTPEREADDEAGGGAAFDAAAAWAGLEAMFTLLDLRTIHAELPPERVQGIEGARPGEPWNAEGVACVEYRCRALQEYSLLSRM